MVKKNLVLPAAVIVAALIVAASVGFFALNPGVQKPIVVQLPGYLENASSAKSEGTLPGSDGTISFAAGDDSDAKVRLISVSGAITKTASPELAYVTLGIETVDKSASKSQSDNAALANKVMEALLNAGISSDDIETSGYSVREEFEWNESLRKSVSIGYRTTNSITAKVLDLAKVGSTIDVAVQAGANNVSSVSFSLSKEKESELKTLALQEAAANARAKAQSIASGLGISVGQVYSASESSSYIVPYYAKSYSMGLVNEATAPTPISPGGIEFTATVSVQFEIQ